jgi:hypothetical protein
MSPHLPLRELEEARADPDGYRATFFGPPRQAQGSLYFSALRNAIFNLHKRGWTVADAEAYLESALEKHPNAMRKAEVSDQFAWYVTDTHALNPRGGRPRVGRTDRRANGRGYAFRNRAVGGTRPTPHPKSKRHARL